jgi:hypothetical protein
VYRSHVFGPARDRPGVTLAEDGLGPLEQRELGGLNGGRGLDRLEGSAERLAITPGLVAAEMNPATSVAIAWLADQGRPAAPVGRLATR